ncbi:hypothetical protein GUJ93_ZPchr0009g238 [Zizania palustris]|uniref:Auxin-responsive protein n=2 Tax=Zizania palustris TaxID=103762 RepID=A0A8J5RMB6_ZIZPA|nr:hypothetical protein GUJ93_ZPchr0009g238 [Zizania palustris]
MTRGENGELRVGVRRAMRQQANIPSSVISSHSMHLGVLATAWHAVNTGTMFTVYYKPRTSPSEFVVPRDLYEESLKRKNSIGMRFKMTFEGEEAAEQRFTGTIVGIGDTDPSGWADSKWRSLKVRWDEAASVPRPDRVSPWQIEPANSPSPVNPLPAPRTKRPRPNVIAATSDLSTVNKEGLSFESDHLKCVFLLLPLLIHHVPVHLVASKVIANSPQNCLPMAFHSQESTSLRSRFDDSNELKTSQKLIMRSSGSDQEKNNGAVQRELGSQGWMQMRRPASSTEMLSGFQPLKDAHNQLSSFPCQISGNNSNTWNTVNVHYPDQHVHHNMFPGTWPFRPHNTGFGVNQHKYLMMPDITLPQRSLNAKFGGNGAFTSLRAHGIDHRSSGWHGRIETSSHIDDASSSLTKPQHLVIGHDVQKTKGSSCMLFGISLDSPSKPESLISPPSVAYDGKPQNPLSAEGFQHDAFEKDECSDPSKIVKPLDGAQYDSVSEKHQSCPEVARNIQNKLQNGSSRSCKKVHKQGIALGRSIDLTKFTCYDELIAELDRMFDFDGELKSSCKNWMVVYTDNEGDMMLVGDDPWNEFCNMVHKIFIYTREEVQKMNPGALNSRSEDSLSNSLEKGLAGEGL